MLSVRSLLHACCSAASNSWQPCGLQPARLLSMGFSRQEYQNGLPFPPLGNLPDPGIELASLASPALAGGFFTTEPPGKARYLPHKSKLNLNGSVLLSLAILPTFYLKEMEHYTKDIEKLPQSRSHFIFLIQLMLHTGPMLKVYCKRILTLSPFQSACH